MNERDHNDDSRYGALGAILSWPVLVYVAVLALIVWFVVSKR
jgi:hypothetical protein